MGLILVGELRCHRLGSEKKKVLAIKQEYRSSVGPYSVFVSLLVPQKVMISWFHVLFFIDDHLS